MTGTALILGASGRFGRHAAQAFARRGWTLRRFDRAHDELSRAARGADVIVNAWNPPYPDWAAQVPGLHARVREAAKAADATVIVPGNVYVFGPDAPAPWSQWTPHLARNPLGRIRIEMERAYREDGVRTIVLRAGDFLDDAPSGNWFDRVMTPGLARGRFVYPGRTDIPHAWAYLPDMARAAVDLAELRDQLPRFSDIPFPGYTLSGRKMREMLEGIAGRPVALKPMAWWQLRLARPFWPMARHLLEMRYLWDTPHRLDGARFRDLLPGFAHTPAEEALRAATADLLRPQPGGMMSTQTSL